MYYVKAIESKQNLLPSSSVSDCTSQLSLDGAPAAVAYTAVNISVITKFWAYKPTGTAANEIKVIHGVNQ